MIKKQEKQEECKHPNKRITGYTTQSEGSRIVKYADWTCPCGVSDRTKVGSEDAGDPYPDED